ncbi:MAG: hypothetical protein BKP49_10370 [Treponema sp. CETP13]|nr:MAG: hypothetical protein BKP49_10370 [Treponema sp. CETP13]
MKLVKQIKPPKTKGDRIVRIINNFFYVYTGSQVQEVAMELSELDLPAIAVVNEKLNLLGLIKRADLETQLSKPYGRELLQRTSVDELMVSPQIFVYNQSIAVIIEEIRDDFQNETIQYYALVDKQQQFCGIFSSRTMLLYAAQTQQRDIETAKVIQERIIPHYSHFSDDQCEFICSAVMQQAVGGDYYYVKQYSPNKWFFCLCDISGKGISASIVVALLGGYMWNADFSKSMVKFIQGLNKLILQTFNLEKYFTGIFCKFDSKTGLLKYCDMGHGLMYLHRNHKFIPLQSEAVNMPVGIINDISIEKKSILLDNNDTIVLFSDGLSEQENTLGKEFDIQIISKSLEENPKNLKKAKIEIFEKFYQFKDTEVQHDDLSLLFCHKN